MDSRSCAVTSIPSSHPVCEFVIRAGLFAMAVYLHAGREHASDL